MDGIPFGGKETVGAVGARQWRVSYRGRKEGGDSGPYHLLWKERQTGEGRSPSETSEMEVKDPEVPGELNEST